MIPRPKLHHTILRGEACSQRNIPPRKNVLPADKLLKDDSNEEDDLLPKARELVAQAGTASVSMLQRRLRVGFARAARIIDLLEAEGTIGSGNGPGKNREVMGANSKADDDKEEDFFDD